MQEPFEKRFIQREVRGFWSLFSHPSMGTITNSSVSHPVQWANLCARVKTKNEALKVNMNTHTHTCSLISHSHKMASCSFIIGHYLFSRCLGEWLQERRAGRGSERERVGLKGRKFQEAASTDPKFGKNRKDRIAFFFSSSCPENQCTRRTRNREINHCALMAPRNFRRQFLETGLTATWLTFVWAG